VLDSSGSMDTKTLGQGLGAIAAYAFSREVPLVRLVYCDAHAYDAGHVAPEAIGNRMRVQGRGGTVLQPGADLLTTAVDFPKAAPILVITDGYCEPSFRLGREHAFLLPKSGKLPFAPRGPVFRMG
jgi:predicted metal-dependent peptidase